MPPARRAKLADGFAAREHLAGSHALPQVVLAAGANLAVFRKLRRRPFALSLLLLLSFVVTLV